MYMIFLSQKKKIKAKKKKENKNPKPNLTQPENKNKKIWYIGRNKKKRNHHGNINESFPEDDLLIKCIIFIYKIIYSRRYISDLGCLCRLFFLNFFLGQEEIPCPTVYKGVQV